MKIAGISESQGESLAMQKLTKAGRQEDYEKLHQIDTSKNHKHLPKLVDYYLEDPAHLDDIAHYYKKFADNTRINQKDIYQFATFKDFEQLVDSNLTAPKPAATSDNSDKAIYSDDNIDVWVGDTKDKCIQYSKGFTFCIGRVGQGNLYHGYRKTGLTLYFVKSKKRPENDIKRYVVIHAMEQDPSKFGFSEADNHGDVRLSAEDITKQMPEVGVLFQKGIIKPVPLSDRENQMYAVEREEFTSLDADKKMLYIELGRQLTDQDWKTALPEHKAQYIEMSVADLTPEQKATTPPKLLKRYWDLALRRAEIRFNHDQNSDLTADEAIAVLRAAAAEAAPEPVKTESYLPPKEYVASLIEGGAYGHKPQTR